MSGYPAQSCSAEDIQAAYEEGYSREWGSFLVSSAVIFEIGPHVTKAGLEVTMYLRMTLSF